jgi:hypothetical protein
MTVDFTRTKAPWNDEQLELLRLRQGDRRLHPYTHDCGTALIPTHSGWICLKCLGPEVEIPGLGKGRFVQVVQDWCYNADLQTGRGQHGVEPGL